MDAHLQTAEATVAVLFPDHALGPRDAPVEVIEYGDFQCASCQQAYPAVKMLLARHGSQLRFVFRHFPLMEVHPQAMLAAECAEAASAQDAFWPMYDLLFQRPTHLSSADLMRRAEFLGLDLVRFSADLQSHRHRARIEAHVASGQAGHVRATPTFFVDGVRVDTSFGLQRLASTVAQRLSDTMGSKS